MRVPASVCRIKLNNSRKSDLALHELRPKASESNIHVAIW
jgi:hypothetical protein